MICERCGRLRSFAPAELAELKQLVRERYRFEVGFGHFPLAGLCDRCARERGPNRDDHRTTERHPMGEHEHEHGHAHAHEHSHDGESHTHAHTDHDHDHVEHEHEHSHGDLVHSHPHPHQPGLEDDHTHDHAEDERAPRE